MFFILTKNRNGILARLDLESRVENIIILSSLTIFAEKPQENKMYFLFRLKKKVFVLHPIHFHISFMNELFFYLVNKNRGKRNSLAK